ncbi:type IV pilus secretin PilQ [Bdellovibrio bacteriovorus]|uniref:Fimbrial assembly protein n=1 Tax=Bdellovibrio bacteriovorus TaxID=959 RepID=A0A1Z3NAY5_BDEBC|nr:type IV pilus secretin PilQ [Bdellovibrio bacteriovorus]ASD64634.1 fimbrial assembly protein [Bdellovibrio bacteriovorus]
MNGFIRLVILSAMIASLTSCASRPVEDDLSLDGMDSSADVTSADESAPAADSASDDFAEFDEIDNQQPAQAESQAAPAGDQDLAIEEEVNEAGGQEQVADTPAPAPEETSPTEDPFADSSVADVPAQTPEPTVTETTPDPFADQPSITEPAPAPVTETIAAVPSGAPANITDLKFRANETGGTVIVQGDRPLTYTTRTNPDLRQFIIEVDNANLPDRLKRSLNTKDIKGSVGAIDAYQNPGSSTARFVIQMREGVGEPAVQQEGNSLLIVASGSAPAEAAEVTDVSTAMEDNNILPSQNLTEFLAGNTKFYGKKISIETSNMDIRDALNFITEESGVNMVISEDVKGAVSLKLRQVPWDQALVVIMKAKKLGYTRQGNVLRIAPLQDLKAEEDDATKLAQARKNLEPLKVRMFPVSYAKVDELEKKIKDFLGDRGRVVGDVRTNALVVTDIEENLERAARLIASLDTQPAQVSIEGKIVEAKESFTRNIGVNWSATGAPIKLGSTSRGPVNMNPSFNVNQSAAGSSGALNFNLNVGTLDVFGTLSAALALNESEEQVKIISAPRIMTLSNEKADINQTTEVPVRQVTQNGTATQETFQFKPLTLKLEVTPQVTADGSVIMKVLVNRQFRGADVSSAGQGAFAVNSREANTRVLVKNGQTAVIGGIYQSDATDGEVGVPWFRELPFVSYLFKTKNISKEKSELLIFLTPRIMGQIDSNAGNPTTTDF